MDIKQQYGQLNALHKIIAINAVVFFVSFFVQRFFPSVFNWFTLPANFSEFIVQPWSIITYAFLHQGVGHIFVNMLFLYFIGRLFLNLISAKTALNIYFLGAIVGGLVFIFGYVLVPSHNHVTLVGASAAVQALFIFLCAYQPLMEVRLLIVNIKIWYLGAALVALDLMGLFGANTGGNLAHLGGAALGFFYAVQLRNGTDIGRGFERLMDGLVDWFRGRGQRTRMKTVHKTKSSSKSYYKKKDDFNAYNKQKKIDIILDKISKSGYESLTQEEKDFLFRAGK